MSQPRHNQEAIKIQLSRFLDFTSDAVKWAELVNNYDWMKEISFWISSVIWKYYGKLYDV
jgi:tyrosyl-tRNA synthetase